MVPSHISLKVIKLLYETFFAKINRLQLLVGIGTAEAQEGGSAYLEQRRARNAGRHLTGIFIGSPRKSIGTL